MRTLLTKLIDHINITAMVLICALTCVGISVYHISYIASFIMLLLGFAVLTISIIINIVKEKGDIFNE